MDFSTQLFEGELICLGPIDFDKDPEIEAQWTNDPEFMRMMYLEPALPKSAAQVKKQYESLEKNMEESKNQYHFAIRRRVAPEASEQESSEQADRLVGCADLYWIEWSHGSGFIRLGIGDAKDRKQGYGTEALRLLLRYAFNELNLHRLTAVIPEYNEAALRLFQKAGFTEEVRRREAVNRDGQRWDLLHLGILSAEWAAAQAQ